MEVKKKAQQNDSLLELIINVLVPSLILMYLSDENRLGAKLAFITALIPPLCWGIFDLIKKKKINWFAILGLINVLLTGGIGLLQLDTKWLAVKEGIIPLIIGVIVFISSYTKKPLIKAMLFNDKILNIDLINEKLTNNNKQEDFNSYLHISTRFLSATFFFSAFANYFLAKFIVVSETGSQAFNEELGKLTLLSYPIIAIPSMIMSFAILYFLWKRIEKDTGLKFNDLLPEHLKN